MISSVQNTKKGEKKKLLLQQICLKMEKERGIPHSLNEAIIHSAECLLNDIRLSPKQRAKIEQAAATAKMTPQQILSKACEWASRFYGKKYAAGNSSKHFTPGSAYRRVDEFVKALVKSKSSYLHTFSNSINLAYSILLSPIEV